MLCTNEQAVRIFRVAHSEQRTISVFILNVVLNPIKINSLPTLAQFYRSNSSCVVGVFNGSCGLNSACDILHPCRGADAR